MAWAKAKPTVIMGLGILLLGGAVTTFVLQAEAHSDRDQDPVADQFKKQPPIDADTLRQKLVGRWALETKRLGYNNEYTHYTDDNRQKSWTLTDWAIVRYDAQSNIVYSASGPYELKGDLYTETIQHATGLMTNYLGTQPQYRLRVDGNKYYQMSLGDKPALEEIGHRLAQ